MNDPSPSTDAAHLRFDIFTIFPSMFTGPMDESIVRRARDRGVVSLHVHDIRSSAQDRHRSTDDTPYGGGSGMVMSAPPIITAVESTLEDDSPPPRVIIMSPAGRLFTQELARDLSGSRRVVIICGHYEGIDDRVRSILDAEEVSIGDYVLTGGEIPAMVVIDAVARLLPGVIADHSVTEESHSHGLVEYPHYTRPAEYRGHTVPAILLSGHHANIAAWRKAEALRRTRERRPDLLTCFPVTPATSTEQVDAASAGSGGSPGIPATGG
jgi:tRNA (guanine37-N1)-methyltransferase